LAIPLCEDNQNINDRNIYFEPLEFKSVGKFQSVALGYETKEEIIKWMVDTQLGRRNLTPIQKIAIAEKYRPIFEKKAEKNLSNGGGDKKSGLAILPKAIDTVNTRDELSKIAGVSHDTYTFHRYHLLDT